MARLLRSVAVRRGNRGMQVLARVEEVERLLAAGQFVGEERPVVGAAVGDLAQLEVGALAQHGAQLRRQRGLERALPGLGGAGHAERTEQLALGIAERERSAADLAVAGRPLALPARRGCSHQKSSLLMRQTYLARMNLSRMQRLVNVNVSQPCDDALI